MGGAWPTIHHRIPLSYVFVHGSGVSPRRPRQYWCVLCCGLHSLRHVHFSHPAPLSPTINVGSAHQQGADRSAVGDRRWRPRIIDRTRRPRATCDSSAAPPWCTGRVCGESVLIFLQGWRRGTLVWMIGLRSGLGELVGSRQPRRATWHSYPVAQPACHGGDFLGRSHRKPSQTPSLSLTNISAGQKEIAPPCGHAAVCMWWCSRSEILCGRLRCPRHPHASV
ncbi:hypothetical protein C8Q77DRAFT_482368 [Trametes polyzona]|nr:hypothetical protein C8Q77DRAFT_482368 [Trametes polyzona]